MSRADGIDLTIEATTETTKFDRYFSKCIGSCHAYLTLREDYRQHVRAVQKEIGFRNIRCHGIFHDWVGVCHDGNDGLTFNFQNVDKIYDFFLEVGLKPYVELGFMPKLLASDLSKFTFRYEANISPPRDFQLWNELVSAFVRHLVQRYGIEEVTEWYFEVWNEPDLKDLFWSGSQAEYFELYRHTVTTIKSIDNTLKVGGPSTSKNQWLEETLNFCHEQQLPIDFISTHHYCADAALETNANVFDLSYRGQKAMRDDVQRTRTIVENSVFQDIEIHYTEWNVSPCHEDRFGKDSEFTAAFILQTLKDVSGLVDVYSYWCISDIFEETGPSLTPFSGKYGLVNIHGIKKPSFHAFQFLSQLYDEKIPTDSNRSYVTRQGENWRILHWNFVDPTQTDFNGGDYQIPQQKSEDTITLTGIHGRYQLKAYRVDANTSNSYRAWVNMGQPQYLSQPQIEQLKQCGNAELVTEKIIEVSSDLPELTLKIELDPNGIVFYELTHLTPLK